MDGLQEVMWNKSKKKQGVHPHPKQKNQRIFSLRGNESLLVVDDEINECYFLRWKTFNKLQRKGKELDPRYFDEKERAAFNASDAKEWQSFIDTGAVIIIPPAQAQHVPQSRIFQRPMRYVRTNKNKEENEEKSAKSQTRSQESYRDSR